MGKENKRFFVEFHDGRKEVGVGDTVFTVGRNGDTYEEKITSFGIKYLNIEGRKDQYDMNTGHHNSDYPRILWSSKEAYEAECDRERMILCFRNTFTNQKNYSIEQLKKAAEYLGLLESLETEFEKGRRVKRRF